MSKQGPIIGGTQFTFDTDGLAAISKAEKNGSPGIALSYKLGVQLFIQFDSLEERNTQYEKLVTIWQKERME